MDPWLETADINLNDNHWPRKTQLTKFELFKQKKRGWGDDGKENLMQRHKRNEELKKVNN